MINAINVKNLLQLNHLFENTLKGVQFLVLVLERTKHQNLIQMLARAGLQWYFKCWFSVDPPFRSTKCKLSQLANSDIQINQLPLARCIVFSQFFKLLSKMFIVCWALNNIKRGNKRFDSPSLPCTTSRFLIQTF